jgi:hypothetical protein
MINPKSLLSQVKGNLVVNDQGSLMKAPPSRNRDGLRNNQTAEIKAKVMRSTEKVTKKEHGNVNQRI